MWGLFGKSDHKKITPDEARKMMEEDKNIVLLDVRTPAEFKDVRIKNAKLIPGNELDLRAKLEIPDLDTKIIVYCHSGGRSNAAAKKLTSLGYTNIYDVGGIISYPYDRVQG